jgi:hypothetical protein
MRKKKLNLILLALLFLGSASVSLAQETSVRSESYKKGEIEAAENLKNEKFVFKAWGLSFSKLYSWESAEEIYNRILKEICYRVACETLTGLVAVSAHVTSAVRRFFEKT